MTLLCALTSKPLGDKESEYAKKSGPRRLHENERLGVRRFDTFFPIEQVEPYKDRQGIGNKLGHKMFIIVEKRNVPSKISHLKRPEKKTEGKM